MNYYTRAFQLLSGSAFTFSYVYCAPADDDQKQFYQLNTIIQLNHNAEPKTLTNSILLLPNILTMEECQYLSQEADRVILNGYSRDTYSDYAEMLRRREKPLRRISLEDMNPKANKLSSQILLERVLPKLENKFPELLKSLKIDGYRQGKFEWASDEPTVNRYTQGGQFEPHEDAYSLSVIILLTDDFEGGGTSFWPTTKEETAMGKDMWKTYEKGILVKPEIGTALLFNGDITHSGNRVTSGVRHLYVGSFNVE